MMKINRVLNDDAPPEAKESYKNYQDQLRERYAEARKRKKTVDFD